MKLRSILLTTTAFVTAFALSSLAAEISTVRLNLSPDKEDTMAAGEMASGDEPGTYDSTYFVYDYSISGTKDKPKTAYTYTIDVHPSEGFSFSDNCAVEVSASTSVSILSRTNQSIRVKATTFPFYILKNPKNFSESGNEMTWDKVDYADRYSVYIYWEDSNGDDHETHTTVSNNKHKVSISSYNSNDRVLKYISVQAQATGDGGKFIANSQYVRSDDGGIDDDKTESGYVFNIPVARSNSLTTSSTTATVKNSAEKVFGPGFNLQDKPGTTNSPEGTWMQYMNDWYYCKDGQFLTGWICPDGVNWYLLGSNGAMLTGLQRVNGKWYLLNPNEGSTKGARLYGWWQINDKWYYFNQQQGDDYGVMLTNTTTPDGLHVGSDGAYLGF